MYVQTMWFTLLPSWFIKQHPRTLERVSIPARYGGDPSDPSDRFRSMTVISSLNEMLYRDEEDVIEEEDDEDNQTMITFTQHQQSYEANSNNGMRIIVVEITIGKPLILLPNTKRKLNALVRKKNE